MRESKFKSRLTWYILTAKIAVVLYILFEYSVKGYSGEQTVSLISLIIPLFAVYLTAMIKDASGNRYVETEEKVEDKLVKKSFVRLSNFLFIIYPLAIILIIYIGGQMASFKFSQSGITIVESGLGAYIGQIVFSMFKKAD
ncbi:MAG: hypothetical protein KAI79_02735 [Bacteroidales bacterium]|nr:hypothetical protein [Bacteroidales bacterium]